MVAPQTATEPILIQPAANPGTGFATVNIFNGARQPFASGARALLTVLDGAQNQLFRDYIGSPSVRLELPFHNNFADRYTILAHAEGYEDAGFQPVEIGPHIPAQTDLMLLSKIGSFHFAHARWNDLVQRKPRVARIFEAGAGDLQAAGSATDAYADLMETHPERLACLLNIATALEQILLPQGSPFDYFKTFDIAALAPDRIFGYADARLVDQVRLAAHHGQFAILPAIDLALHGDATASFKQIQFGEANVQLTFHEHRRRTIDGVDCVYVEPDIDYYKDLGAHGLLEVIPNQLTGNVSNPRVVYVLRWIAGRHAGVPEFDPLYTIE